MSDTKSETIKKANTKKAAMKNVGHKIEEFGVKNMQAGSKARGTKKDGVAKPKTNLSSKEPAGKGEPSRTGSGNANNRGAKKKSF